MAHKDLLPDEDSDLVRLDIRVAFQSPRTIRGFIGIVVMRFALWCGVEPVLEPNGVDTQRFGDLPLETKDRLLAEMLTAPSKHGGVLIKHVKKDISNPESST